MNAPRKQWLGIAIVVGIVYGVVGIGFALPTQNVVRWRLAAWVVCAAVYSAHLTYEQFRLGNSSLTTALHATAAVALGAFILAGYATIHNAMMTSPAPYWRFMLALIIWPIITALPAFLFALVACAVLTIARPAA